MHQNEAHIRRQRRESAFDRALAGRAAGDHVPAAGQVASKGFHRLLRSNDNDRPDTRMVTKRLDGPFHHWSAVQRDERLGLADRQPVAGTCGNHDHRDCHALY
jgi:hypothetical protein